jgi:hypothetical protein
MGNLENKLSKKEKDKSSAPQQHNLGMEEMEQYVDSKLAEVNEEILTFNEKI